VRQRCARLLPDYLRPAVVAVLAELPTLPTGKRDTAAVAAALAEHIGRRATGGRPAGTRWERLVIEEFQAQLGEQVQDVDADFFELGGHSLLAARVVAALRTRTGLPVSMRHLLEQPTAAAVGAALAELDASAGA
jgi:acyl carrier protein